MYTVMLKAWADNQYTRQSRLDSVEDCIQCHASAGMVSISPSSGVALVCFGGHLELMCTTSLTGQFLRWSFSLIRGSDTTPTLFTRTIIPSVPASDAVSYLIVNSVTFNFSRISAQNDLPLMSQLLMGPVSRGLNGTEVNCEDLSTSETAVTVINVIECQCPGKYMHIFMCHASYVYDNHYDYDNDTRNINLSCRLLSQY